MHGDNKILKLTTRKSNNLPYNSNKIKIIIFELSHFGGTFNLFSRYLYYYYYYYFEEKPKM